VTEPMPMPPPAKTGGITAPPVKSKGEKLFDKITYVGIAGIGTLIVTVPIAYELEHHSIIKPYFDKAVARTEALLSKLPLRNPYKTATEAVRTTTLMQGGNLMLIPVGLMEYFKVPIVRGFNAAANDTTPESQIEKAPKQTLSSLIKSRLLAWGVVFASFTGVGKAFPGTLKTFENEVGGHVVKLANRFRTANKQIIPQLQESTRTFGYGKIAALDVFATAAAATLLYLGGHFFARKQEEKIEKRAEQKLVQGGSMQRDVAYADAVDKAAAPSSSITGEKQHEGNAITNATPQLH
jgi:hypothetical protein